MIKINILLLLLLLLNGIAYAQSDASRNHKVFVTSANKSEHAADVNDELVKQLKDWNYWVVTDKKNDADLLLYVNIQTHRGMTAWSWGGVTVRASASLQNLAGEDLWTSKEYKAPPNGTNGFNTARATAGKIIKEMQKRFR